jgi:hypothetical protein
MNRRLSSKNAFQLRNRQRNWKLLGSSWRPPVLNWILLGRSSNQPRFYYFIVLSLRKNIKVVVSAIPPPPPLGAMSSTSSSLPALGPTAGGFRLGPSETEAQDARPSLSSNFLSSIVQGKVFVFLSRSLQEKFSSRI